MHNSSVTEVPSAGAAVAPGRRLLFSTAAAALLAFGLGACSTTDGGGSGTSGDGSSTGAGRAGAGVTGGALTGDQLREALSREGVSDRVLFAYDSSDLSAEARGTVEKWARVLNQYGGTKVVIEGHCDERGTREYNLGLGERRANAAKNYLVSQGIEARRVATISYGKERPAVNGSNEAAWSQNRRGVAVVN